MNRFLFDLIFSLILKLVKVVRDLAVVLIRTCDSRLLNCVNQRLHLKDGFIVVRLDEIFTIARLHVIDVVSPGYCRTFNERG